MGPGVIKTDFSGIPMVPSWMLPFGTRPMLPLDWRNTVLDRWFYNIGVLSTEEQRAVLGFPQSEGAAMLMAPAIAGKAIDYIPRRGFAKLKSATFAGVVVAGVGSSALGTAALARQVADALDEPVLGVVSGRGMADLVSEALGGWFVFRTENMVGEAFDLWRRMGASLPCFGGSGRQAETAEGFFGDSLDSNSLMTLLNQFPDKVRFLVGHSKGNAVIANALRGLLIKRPVEAARLSGLEILTLGAAVGFPPGFDHVFQVIGGADAFGAMNSDAVADHVVPAALHHLNPDIPGALSLAEALAALPSNWRLHRPGA